MAGLYTMRYSGFVTFLARREARVSPHIKASFLRATSAIAAGRILSGSLVRAFYSESTSDARYVSPDHSRFCHNSPSLSHFAGAH